MITHIKDPESDKCIVFIHGLGGSKKTWLKFSKYLCHNWDSDFGFVFKYFLYYKIIFDEERIFNYFKNRTLRSIIKGCLFIPSFCYLILKMFWSKRNSHNAKLLKEYIDKNCQGSKNIIMICHSMGGLIARQFLIDCRKDNIDIKRFKLLITYATPHNGSHRANYFTIKNLRLLNYIYLKISKRINYRLSPQIGDLIFSNEFIQTIDNEWRDFNLERKILFLRIVAKKDFLVERNSAILHEKNIENIYEYEFTHSGIIRPENNFDDFGPIDVLIKALDTLNYEEEEYFEEVEVEMDDSNDSEDFDSY
jgi:pimeloyl-ACP methyl ester carboxylesterase